MAHPHRAARMLPPLRLFLAATTCLVAGLAPARAQLIAYYSFNGSAVDDSGNGHAPAVQGATYTTVGHPGGNGGAYVFDGSTSYIEIPSLDINPTTLPQLTMGAWVYVTDPSSIRQVISHDDAGLDRSLGIDYRSGTDGWSAFAGSGWIAGEAVAAGRWTFVALAMDQAAGTATLYVDDRAYTYTGTTYGSGWTTTRIGMNPSFGEYFAGTIDEVFFYGGTLDATQLAAVRLHGLAAVPEPSTIALLGCGLLFLAAFSRRGAAARARTKS